MDVFSVSIPAVKHKLHATNVSTASVQDPGQGSQLRHGKVFCTSLTYQRNLTSCPALCILQKRKNGMGKGGQGKNVAPRKEWQRAVGCRSVGER